MKTIKLFLIAVMLVIVTNLYSRGGGGHGGGGHSSSSHSSSHGSTGHVSSSHSSESHSSFSKSRTASRSFYKTPSGRTVRHSAYKPVETIRVNEYHYYHYNNNNWLWWYLIYNYHTHRQDTIRASTKQELDKKVISASSTY